jgi:RNA polymerase sigma-70 factor (ECF subfamily)
MQSLIQKLHENDEAAFEDIYRLIHQKIYNFILRYVQDRSSAQELTQLFFIKLWEKRQMLHLDKPLEAQCFVIARNLVIDALRKAARDNRLIESFHIQRDLITASTEEVVLFDNLREHFEAAVEALPTKRKEIFKLSRLQGLTYQEIANQLSISPKTVEIQMSKALKMVRAKLSAFLHVFL